MQMVMLMKEHHGTACFIQKWLNKPFFLLVYNFIKFSSPNTDKYKDQYAFESKYTCDLRGNIGGNTCDTILERNSRQLSSITFEEMFCGYYRPFYKKIGFDFARTLCPE